MKNRWLIFSCLASVLVLDVTGAASVPQLSFSEASEGIIPLEDRSRRKWDTPILADLDQDGLMDLILTDHSYRVNIHWNEGGTFSGAVRLVGGDIHGVTVGDYDRDGLVDLILYPGGGNGANPRQPQAYHFDGRNFKEGKVFEDLIPTRGRVVKLVDFDNDGQLELLANGFGRMGTDQIKHGANFVYAMDESGDFQFSSRLPHGDRLSSRMLVTDFNNDNDFDVIIYGGKTKIAAAEGSEGLDFKDATESVLGTLQWTTNASSIVEIDYDNDGDFDLFVTRSEHPFNNRSVHDKECGCYAFFSRFKPYEVGELKIDGDFVLENLQMAYPSFDVLVGAEKRLLEFDVDRHGHKDFTLKAAESFGWPEQREGKGLYIGYLGEQTWRVLSDTKSATSGVIHNVISNPSTLPPEDMPALLLENRDGVFVEVTGEMGISISEQTTGCAVGDFDNDGWSDLFVVRYGNAAKKNEQVLYRNLKGKSFERIEGHGIVSQELGTTGMGAEAFDYDMDGDLDIMYSNERGRWHLFTNDFSESGNNYLKVNVGDSPSGGATALGAMVTVKAGGNIYKRFVGQTSSSFGQPANTTLHVGLGTVDEIDSAQVRWSNGETQSLKVDTLNETVSTGKR